MFQDCTNLRHLFLSENRITKVPPKLLHDKAVLKTVDLSRNQIKSIPEGFTKNNEGLENLYLNENLIEEIPMEVFDVNKKLKVVDLHKNRIRNVTPRGEKMKNENSPRVNLLDLRGNEKLGILSKLFHRLVLLL